MPYGLYISADGAQAQSQWIEAIANNLANVDTVGFKRELAVFQSRYAEAIRQGSVSPGAGGIDDVGGGVAFKETKTDFSSGPLKRTGVATDVALQNEGFFLVRKGQENYLTRAGNFRLTATGELVTAQGHQVLSDNGTPIVIQRGAGSWEITPDGAVRQAGVSQNLALVRPASTQELVKTGENLFRASSQPQPVPPAQRQVASGYLEMSGVRPTLEMTALIEASRLLEANVNMMKAQDQMLGGLVNRLLKA
jgi:flagellar basal-body rod protein FlgF